jgi:hypothetical protein
MKKQVARVAMLLISSAFFSYANAQVNYSYDNNGNRTSSWVEVYTMSMVHSKDSNKNDSNKVTRTIKVYPNPTPGNLNVAISSIQTNEFATIYFSDASGNLLTTQKDISTLTQASLWDKLNY